jgi:hypothetical protein
MANQAARKKVTVAAQEKATKGSGRGKNRRCHAD